MSSKSLKVVFDTNIYISAIIFGGNPRACLEMVRSGEISLFTSKDILLEIAQILGNKLGWPEKDVREVIAGISTLSTLVQPQVKLEIVEKDPTDNKILEAALEAEADFIVSGDKKHILPLKEFEGIKIISSAEFLKLI